MLSITALWKGKATLAILLAAVALLMLLAPGAARPASAAESGLTWKISEMAWTSGSLSQSHSTEAPAIKDPVNGFVFPIASTNYDEATGALDIQFTGSITLGNVSFGGFRIVIGSPRVVVDESGAGVVRADVSYCASAAACLDPLVGPAPGVKMTTFQLAPGAIQGSGEDMHFTVTPFWAEVGNQFDSEFLNALDPALRGFFRATGSGSDPLKPPAPLTVSFSSVQSVGGSAGLLRDGAGDDGSSGAPAALMLITTGVIATAVVGSVIFRKRAS
jgi:hypothetical protein